MFGRVDRVGGGINYSDPLVRRSTLGDYWDEMTLKYGGVSFIDYDDVTTEGLAIEFFDSNQNVTDKVVNQIKVDTDRGWFLIEEKVAKVSEASIIALLGLGLVFIGFMRRFNPLF